MMSGVHGLGQRREVLDGSSTWVVGVSDHLHPVMSSFGVSLPCLPTWLHLCLADRAPEKPRTHSAYTAHVGAALAETMKQRDDWLGRPYSCPRRGISGAGEN